jgi:hypothetical protein
MPLVPWDASLDKLEGEQKGRSLLSAIEDGRYSPGYPN